MSCHDKKNIASLALQHNTVMLGIDVVKAQGENWRPNLSKFANFSMGYLIIEGAHKALSKRCTSFIAYFYSRMNFWQLTYTHRHSIVFISEILMLQII